MFNLNSLGGTLVGVPGKRRKGEAARPIPRNYVRQWRKHFRLTIMQLAEKAELSKATISDVETGKQDVTGATLLAIAKGLGNDVKPATLLMCGPNDAGRMPWEIWERLTPERQEAMKAAMQAMDLPHRVRNS